MHDEKQQASKQSVNHCIAAQLCFTWTKLHVLQTALRKWSQSNIATSLRHLKHKLPFSKEPSRPSSSAALQETIPAFRAAHQKVLLESVATMFPVFHAIRSDTYMLGNIQLLSHAWFDRTDM